MSVRPLGAAAMGEGVAMLPPARPWRRAGAWLAFLGPFFFASYGFANWVASLRSDVPVVVFDWERNIPFMPWTILPYWSIDLLYGVSLFVCTSKRELDVHARRLLCAQLLCIAVFVAFPLRFSFERPATSGWSGTLFDALAGFDRPFNQMPSLHVALLVILWLRYLRHVDRSRHWIVHGWGALIAVSVLTTYQHHFIDLVTGVWAGWLCVWLVPEDGSARAWSLRGIADVRRRTLAFAYAAAALACAALALATGGFALWLLWPAAALAMVAVVYSSLDASAFDKGAHGVHESAARWLFAPYFVLAWLNSRWWTRRHPAADEVVPGLFIGRVPGRAEAEPYAAIVDLSAELQCSTTCARYVSVPQLDLTAPTSAHLQRAVAAIDEARAAGPVLVCCALGYSRSAVAVAAWLLASGRASGVADAIDRVRGARPRIVLGAMHTEVLQRYAAATSRDPSVVA